MGKIIVAALSLLCRLQTLQCNARLIRELPLKDAGSKPNQACASAQGSLAAQSLLRSIFPSSRAPCLRSLLTKLWHTAAFKTSLYLRSYSTFLHRHPCSSAVYLLSCSCSCMRTPSCHSVDITCSITSPRAASHHALSALRRLRWNGAWLFLQELAAKEALFPERSAAEGSSRSGRHVMSPHAARPPGHSCRR